MVGQLKKNKPEKDYIDIKVPSSTSPIFGNNNPNRQETQTLKTEAEEKISLRDYLLSNKESLKSRNEEIVDLEKSRLEMRMTNLLEKEKEVFNKTREIDEARRYGDNVNTRREPTHEDFVSQKNDRSKRSETINYDDVRFFLVKQKNII